MTDQHMSRVDDARKTAIERVAAALVDLIVATTAATSAAPYSATNLPAGVPSRRAFYERVCSMRGAHKIGRGWTIAAEAWNEAIAKTPPKKKTIAAPPAGDSVDEILAASGTRLRSIRGGR